MNAKKAKKLRKQFRINGVSIKRDEMKYERHGVKRDPVSGRMVAYAVGADAGDGRRTYKKAKRLFDLIT